MLGAASHQPVTACTAEMSQLELQSNVNSVNWPGWTVVNRLIATIPLYQLISTKGLP
jgi:hypothetical protein